MMLSPTRLFPLLLALALAGLPAMARAVEEPRFTVVQQLDGAEVRDYAAQVVAEVVVPGPADEAGNQGFRLLAGYIFGKNKGARTLAMTAPVSQSAEPTKIAMTAPVAQAAAPGGFTVRFMMPSAYTLATLPEPVDPQVQLRELPATRVAVIRYSGFWTEAAYQTQLARLRQAVAAAGLRSSGEPTYARYDPPWVPWFLRRNEIWLPLG